MAQYYSDLLDAKSFRLATISVDKHPETGTQVPNVTLITHALSSAPEITYNALSYTWGPPRPGPADSEAAANPSILLNRNISEVQPNLYDALLELHASCSEAPIWIDALCINQSSPNERSAQVSVMNQIYGKANRVIVWLGKAFPELEAGLRAAERIGTQSVPETLRMIGTQTWDFSSDLSTMPERYGMEPINQEEAVGLIQVFMSNWLARVWIIQEVSLTEDVVVLCNGKYTRFDCVGLTATFLHYSGFFQSVLNLVPRDRPGIYFRGDIYIFQAERIQLLREWCKGERSLWVGVLSMIDFEAGLGKDHAKSSSMLLLRLLFSTFGLQATDRRDSIYGLGGILKHMAAEEGLTLPSEFEPNYDIDIKDLLLDVACKIIETTDSLIFLSLVKEPSLRETPELPSWAPDFPPIMHNSVHGPQFRSIGTVNASKHVPHATREHPFSIDGETLYVSGIRLGAIQKLGEEYIDAVRGRLNLLGDILLSMDKIYPYTKQPADEVLWRTLIWDTDFTYRPSKLIRIEDFQRTILSQIVHALAVGYRAEESKAGGEASVTASIQSMTYLDDIAAKFPSSIFPSVELLNSACVDRGLITREGKDLNDGELQNLQKLPPRQSMPPDNLMASTWGDRRPFLTDMGYLGMGYVSSEVGDELWIVSGCPTPMILRKTGLKKNEYSLIGETYVHGAMQGEAVTEDAAWEKIEVV
ncbi:heterokaryon incompatibility protein-domain-containing protein [Fusarium oxysporum f. sp. albedinis]|nr:heterokaryon incompatibility protein-domain-containing protein [Fusarium oxysporum f. sp. albedinis]KAK2470053.1 hypothetical protein H9L39_18201 [Fusarium oxysporum f. sp. albedinis]